MAYLNDEPTLSDALGREEMVKAVGEAVADCDPPHVFGIHGDWGCGKTSFLCQLALYLTGECPNLNVRQEAGAAKARKMFKNNWKPRDHVTVVWFEAWRYQNEPAPIVALLQAIRAQLSRSAKVMDKAKKLGEIGLRASLNMIDGIIGAVGAESLKIGETERIGEDWEKRHAAFQLPADAVREQLQYEIDRVLCGEQKVQRPAPKLVVLIDDLDRCEASAAFRLLEGIKIYLTLNNCVFVLAMDEEVIRQCIADSLAAHSPDRDSRSRGYLDKICKDIWHLPIINNQAALLGKFLGNKPETAEIVNVLNEYRCLPANPRKIKAFANLIQRYMQYLDAPISGKGRTAKARRARLTVIMAYLYLFHHEIYRRIEGEPRFYEKVVRWSQGEADDHPVFKNLERALKEKSDESTHPDPVLGNVLRIQGLIRSLKDVTTDEIAAYLLDQPGAEASETSRK